MKTWTISVQLHDTTRIIFHFEEKLMGYFVNLKHFHASVVPMVGLTFTVTVPVLGLAILLVALLDFKLLAKHSYLLIKIIYFLILSKK